MQSTPGLYVHVPFCKSKCPYCDFYSITDLAPIDAWLDALKKEAALFRGDFAAFNSLYIGGGTPSLLSNGQIKTLSEIIRSNFSFFPDTEGTVEVNPDDVTLEKLEVFQTLGINRLSIGVQSFNDRELLFLKRRHNASAAVKAVKLARSQGFKNIGIDLMYGFEGQTMAGWQDTMKAAVDLEPMHLSCYQFTLAETTPFGKLKAEGRLRSITEEEERTFFLFTSDFLKPRGFIHYEISNYSKGRRHFSRHNMKYWQHTAYLGLGPAAHSFKDNVRWWNCRSVEDYCRLLSQGKRPVEGSETLTDEQLKLERLFLGLRTERGIPVNDICHGASASQALTGLRKEGFVKIRNGRVIPTQKGYLIADRLPLLLTE